MKKIKGNYTRKYLGVTITANNYKEILKEGGRKLVNFHTRHLDAYLKGNEEFPFGRRWNDFWMRWEPVMHKVQQELLEINPQD